MESPSGVWSARREQAGQRVTGLSWVRITLQIRSHAMPRDTWVSARVRISAIPPSVQRFHTVPDGLGLTGTVLGLPGGGRGIRTPGGLPLNGFQDRRNRPLCHPSERPGADGAGRAASVTAIPRLSARPVARSSVIQCVGLAPGHVGVAPHGGAVRAGRGVRAEELHVACLILQVAQAVGDELVVDVALEVDQEAVVAEAPLGGAGLELGQVDGPRRELLEDGEQAARARRPAGTRRSRSCRDRSAPGCRPGPPPRSGSRSRGGPRCRRPARRARRPRRRGPVPRRRVCAVAGLGQLRGRRRRSSWRPAVTTPRAGARPGTRGTGRWRGGTRRRS